MSINKQQLIQILQARKQLLQVDQTYVIFQAMDTKRQGINDFCEKVVSFGLMARVMDVRKNECIITSYLRFEFFQNRFISLKIKII